MGYNISINITIMTTSVDLSTLTNIAEDLHNSKDISNLQYQKIISDLTDNQKLSSIN